MSSVVAVEMFHRKLSDKKMSIGGSEDEESGAPSDPSKMAESASSSRRPEKTRCRPSGVQRPPRWS